VEREYHDLLQARASGQRWLYLIERVALWLAPLLLAGLALGLQGSILKTSLYVRWRTVVTARRPDNHCINR